MNHASAAARFLNLMAARAVVMPEVNPRWMAALTHQSRPATTPGDDGQAGPVRGSSGPATPSSDPSQTPPVSGRPSRYLLSGEAGNPLSSSDGSDTPHTIDGHPAPTGMAAKTNA